MFFSETFQADGQAQSKRYLEALNEQQKQARKKHQGVNLTVCRLEDEGNMCIFSTCC